MSVNRMHPFGWIPQGTKRLLDVGCNAGELLRDIANSYPSIQLAGVDVNPNALETARKAVPSAEIHQLSSTALPFAEGSFDYATFIEVIEHVPTEDRRALLEEIHRVLAPGCTLLLRCPHAGWFDWLDSNNLRFHFPWLYSKLVGTGRRDLGYSGGSKDVVWHHHFTEAEMRNLTQGLFELKQIHYGGFLLFPIVDILRWPFYRKKMLDNPILGGLEKLADFDMGLNFGKASFTVLFEFKRV